MREFIATVTAEGQVIIPEEIRDYLGIRVNDTIAFVIDSESAVRIKVLRHPDVASIRGAAGSLNKSLSWSERWEIAYEDRFKTKFRNEEQGIIRREP